MEAKSRVKAQEIASQLGQLGFKTVENEDDAQAGKLNLSQNPAAIQAKIASFPVSRRGDQVLPLIWAFCSLALIPRLNTRHYPYWLPLSFGAMSLFMFVWSAIRIWGWKLEILPDGLRVRRRFRWSTIPWEQMKMVESIPTGRSQRVVIKLASHTSGRAGSI